MQHVALLAFDKEKCKPFFDRLTELFYEHHHSEQQNPDEYEKLLYMVKRPYDNNMLDMIDDWMGLAHREWREETTREVKLALYAIRYPDTLLLDSFTAKPRSDIRRLSSYLHLFVMVRSPKVNLYGNCNALGVIAIRVDLSRCPVLQ